MKPPKKKMQNGNELLDVESGAPRGSSCLMNPAVLVVIIVMVNQSNFCKATVRVIARNLAVFSNVTLTKNLYGIRKSGHFTYSWYNNYYSRSCVFFIADMLQILAAVKTSRSPCVVKILQYIFFIFFSLLFCMAERGNAED